ncbi:MAG TPA: metallophosphoesterase [Gemmatimonadaceae bacterium]|nr:metallophosphoesterase [Gemmatimonadaceae bacterium]
MLVTLFLIVGAIIAVGVYAVVMAPRRFHLIELDVPIAGLDAAFDGYTIGVLSDLHQAPLPGLAHTRRALDAVQRHDPDLIALLGDYAVSFKPSRRLSGRLYRNGMRTLTPALRELRAPDGVVALLGNHDYYHDGKNVARWLQSLGITVLRNERVEIRRGAACLTIVGVDDALEGIVDAGAAFEGAEQCETAILLAHNPDSVLHLAGARRPSLVLAGHTHGGQVRLPFYGPPLQFAAICTRRAAQGWIPNPVAPLFVSAGVGSQIPLRAGVLPDAVIVRLRAGEPRA